MKHGYSHNEMSGHTPNEFPHKKVGHQDREHIETGVARAVKRKVTGAGAPKAQPGVAAHGSAATARHDSKPMPGASNAGSRVRAKKNMSKHRMNYGMEHSY